MDFFDFLILAALALPAILRWLGGQSRKGRPQPHVESGHPSGESDVEAETEFERALREISRALGGEVVEPERPAPEPISVADAREPSLHRREDEAFRREEAFEKTGSDRLERASAEPFRRLQLRRIELPAEQVLPPATPKRAPRARTLLRTSATARDAILYSEVLREPLAIRDPDDR